MFAKILLILAPVLEIIKIYLSKKHEETKVSQKKADVNFQSKVEEIAKKAENPETKNEALDEMRKILAE